VLLSGTDEDVASVRAEILAVLEASAKSLGNPDINEIATQCVFNLRDWLSKWVENQRKNQPARPVTGKSKTRRTQEETDFLRIEGFLLGIPAIIMADASYRCHSFARALLHFEYYLRDEIEKKPQHRNQVLQSNIVRLQEIYSKLDEPDGLAGVAKIRENTTLKQRILDFENAGKWSDALSCYDQVISLDPENTYGLLNCLRNLGKVY
jgi:serine/threonine-protein kinase ATR